MASLMHLKFLSAALTGIVFVCVLFLSHPWSSRELLAFKHLSTVKGRACYLLRLSGAINRQPRWLVLTDFLAGMQQPCSLDQQEQYLRVRMKGCLRDGGRERRWPAKNTRMFWVKDKNKTGLVFKLWKFSDSHTYKQINDYNLWSPVRAWSPLGFECSAFL